MIIRALQIGRVVEIPTEGSGEWWDKSWRTGFIKHPQPEACWLAYQGFTGDEQGDPRVHGGVDKAVCVHPWENYSFWHKIKGLESIPCGAFGENLTTEGMLESDVCIGDTYQVGEAQVQVSQPRQPCWKLARRWKIKDLALRMEQSAKTGWYFRVLQHGLVKAGDALTLIDQPFPQWSIERCHEVMNRQKDDLAAARDLASCDALAASWKDDLWARVRKNRAS